VEVRWFYGRNQIAGVTGNGLTGGMEEVFETDELDVVTSDSILFPVVLHSDPNSAQRSQQRLGMPVKDFYCGRFWSLVRKSLIPRGNMDGTKKRGQLYSNFLSKEIFESSNAVLGSIPSKDPSIGGSESPVAWKSAFTRVIKKLTLKDASTEAYDHGAGLIGRENELSSIVSFLRGAIRGDAVIGGVKSSIFIAGPPGVGKTACVRAAIARLHGEKAKGKVPPFSLISLNGMEMRHPYEAYVRLWESLSGSGELRSPEEACRKLEHYFTSPWEAGRGSRDRTVSVVLLDEIDYLVTEKQSVLYNVFDWPRRALDIPNGKRLVVIGISNTLNLAEQLMPSIQSRVGLERCSFKAYNLNDTVDILTAKIKQASPVSGRECLPCSVILIQRNVSHTTPSLCRTMPSLKTTPLFLPRRKLRHCAVIFAKPFRLGGLRQKWSWKLPEMAAMRIRMDRLRLGQWFVSVTFKKLESHPSIWPS
jgi:Cdc6-like AAA superfamily ATPase